jgi:hypothetical protein
MNREEGGVRLCGAGHTAMEEFQKMWNWLAVCDIFINIGLQYHRRDDYDSPK